MVPAKGQTKFLWQDVLAGALTGYFVLHPISMVIVSRTMPGGMGMPQAISAIFKEAIMGHHLTMSIYFTLLGLAFGLVSGFLRARIIFQNKILLKQKIALEDILGEKETLLRILSHDLANPLAAAYGYTELLLEPGSNQQESQEFLCEIKASLDHAKELIDFSRTLVALESGKIGIALVKTDIQKAIIELIPIFKLSLEKKGLTISTEFEKSPVFVDLAPQVFSHTIISNLLSNAIKFSNQNETIKIQVKRLVGKIVISVVNRGPGIPPSKLSVLFSMKEKTTTVGTMGERGTGFGLPLVDKFIAKMNGEISAISSPLADPPGLFETSFCIAFPPPKKK